VRLTHHVRNQGTLRWRTRISPRRGWARRRSGRASDSCLAAAILGIILTLGGRAFAAPASVPMVTEPVEEYGDSGGQLLDQGWRWRTGDDPRQADPDYDDSTWDNVKCWNPPRSGSDPGIAWFRLRFRVADSLQGRVMPFWLTQCGASEVYLNGTRVATFGVVAGTAEGEKPGFADRLTRKYLALPMAARADQVLAIRHSNVGGQKIQHAALGRIRGFALQAFAGSPNAGLAMLTGQVHTLGLHRTFQVVAASAFAILHLLLFAFYPKLNENLHFAVFAVAYAPVIGLGMSVYGSPATPTGALLLARAFPSALILAGTAGCHFLYRLFVAH